MIDKEYIAIFFDKLLKELWDNKYTTEASYKLIEKHFGIEYAKYLCNQ